MKEKIKIGIIGSGSVGRVLSVMLSISGYDVECIDFHKDFKNITSNTFVPMDVVGQFGVQSALIKYVNGKFSTKKDVIILVTKAFNATKAGRIAKASLNPNGFVITLCNTHYIDELFKVIDKSKVVGLFIEWACSRTEKVNRVISKGGNVIGIFHKDAAKYFDTAKQILNKISPTRIEKDMLGFITSRYIINSTITGLGAISGLRLGKILEDHKGKRLFCKMICENYFVSKKLGIHIPKYNHQLDFEEFCGCNFSNKLYRKKMIKTIMIRNSNVVSSTLKLLEDNEKTEIDFILGKFVKYGEQLGIDMKYNKIVYKMIKDIEKNKFQIDDDNLEIAYDLKYDD